MWLEFIVVYNIVEIADIIDHGSVLAYFLEWNWGCCPALGLYYFIGI
jgi:hypothetical protein